MLVLSRRPNEKVLFPSVQASVQVLSVKGSVVRLGVDAPPEVPVLREELAAVGLAGPSGQPQRGTAGRAALGRLTARLAELRGLLPADPPPGTAAALALIEAELEALKRPTPAGRLLASQPRWSARALLVEDNANERELLALFLRQAGLSVDTAGDGADALDYVRAHPRPDVILLDMGLPRCDGPAAVRAIRDDPSWGGVKIVAVTGHAAVEFDLAEGPAGVDRWFQKPVDPAELVRELRRELAGGEEAP